jgi:hypothetical protein
MCTHASQSPAQLVRYFFSWLDTPRILSCPRAGLVSDEFFGGEEGTGGSELAAGRWSWRWTGAKQRQGRAFVGNRQSHVSLESPHGARREATHTLGGSQPEERHGLAAEVFMIDRRRKKPVRRSFDKYFRTQHLLRSGDSIRVFTQPLPLSVPGYR